MSNVDLENHGFMKKNETGIVFVKSGDSTMRAFECE